MNYKLLSSYTFDPKRVKIRQIEIGKRNIDIAREKGITPEDVSRHINGKGRNPLIQRAIAKALDISLEEILLKPRGDSGQDAA